MNQIWFKKAGWLYVPVHAMGLLVTMLAIIFLVPVFTSVIRNGHSGWDNLQDLFAYTTCTMFWWNWVAEKTS